MADRVRNTLPSVPAVSDALHSADDEVRRDAAVLLAKIHQGDGLNNTLIILT
jgi:hypothetical protein